MFGLTKREQQMAEARLLVPAIKEITIAALNLSNSQNEIERLRERVRVLEDALVKISRTEYHIERPPIESLEEQMRRIARAALNKESGK